MCTLYAYTKYIFAEIEAVWIFQALQVSPPTPGLTSSTPCAVCVCVCVIHTHTHTYTPTRAKINRKIQDKRDLCFSFCKDKPPRQRQVLCTDYLNPPTLVPQREWTNCEHTSDVHTLQWFCRRDVWWCQNPLWNIHTCITGTQNTCLVHTTLIVIMHTHPRKHSRATVQQCLRHATIATYPATWALPKKLPDSTTAHGAAAALCHTDIIWSNALVRASSSLFIVRIRPWPPQKSSLKIYFLVLFGLFLAQPDGNRDIVYTASFRRGWARFRGDRSSGTINGALLRPGFLLALVR